MRTFVNVDKQTQKALNHQFPWLHAVSEMQTTPAISCWSISYFDHWLSSAEANSLLGNVLPEQQKHRDTLFFNFMTALADEFEVYSFIFRGRRQDHAVFRRFTSRNAARSFLLPKSLGGTRTQKIQWLLNQQGTVLFEGYDDTSHIYFKNQEQIAQIVTFAKKIGLHILAD